MKQYGDDSLLMMGFVGKPHGIKGEVSIIWHGEESPIAGMTIFLQHEGHTVQYEILSLKEHKNRYIFRLKGVEDRSAAEALNGAQIYVARENLPELEEDEAYLHDLVGYELFLNNGEMVGKLDHVEFPANKIIWAITASDGHEILFPAESQFIISFDHKRQRIYIDPPPGLMDIYRA